MPVLPVLIKQRVHVFVDITLTTHNKLNKPFAGFFSSKFMTTIA